jgi:glutathione synthase/RimK-type ligase-like ATP-grasp enzyme
MARLVFATCDEWPRLLESDGSVADELRARGHDVAAVPWTAGDAAFRGADLVVLRANWDYHRHVQRFDAWLDTLERERVPLRNPARLVRWNLHKRYLLELGARGVKTPVTAIVPLDLEALEAAYAAHGWERAVLKPACGASGHLVECVARGRLAAWMRERRAAAADHEWVVQELIEEIGRAGETSIVFVDGRYSHAVLKVPRPGEFRTNSRYSAVVARTHPFARVLEQAGRAVAMLPEVPLYARVDGVVVGDELCLGELELNEPALYFQHARERVPTFASAIEAALRPRDSS